MGCDIHLYIEQKKKDGIWKQVEIDERLLPDERNYELFGFLAGVRRNDFPAQFPNRGIPKDTSIDRMNFFSSADIHSTTYAYLNELLHAPWKKAKLENCYFKIFCEYVLPRLCCPCNWCNVEECRNIRIIMGFDS